MTLPWKRDRNSRDPETPFAVPRVGMRVIKRNGPFRMPGVIRAILDEGELGHVLVIRYWRAHKRCFHFETCDQWEWELGIVFPKPRKAKSDRAANSTPPPDSVNIVSSS